MLIKIYTLNIYARMRKVINFDRIKEKKLEEKIFKGANYTAFSPLSHPLHPLLKIFYLFCYVIIYNIS